MSYFKAKMHQILFSLGSAPDLTGRGYSAPPDSLARLRGPTSKRMAGRGWKGKRGKGKKEGKGKGRRGREGKEGGEESWYPTFG